MGHGGSETYLLEKAGGLPYFQEQGTHYLLWQSVHFITARVSSCYMELKILLLVARPAAHKISKYSSIHRPSTMSLHALVFVWILIV